MHPLSPNQFGYPLSLTSLAYLYKFIALIKDRKFAIIEAEYSILKGRK